MIPAMRATESTSPFLSAALRIKRAGVALEKRIRARAIATRVVGGLWDAVAVVTGVVGSSDAEVAVVGGVGGGRETMCAAPEGARCVR